METARIRDRGAGDLACSFSISSAIRCCLRSANSAASFAF